MDGVSLGLGGASLGPGRANHRRRGDDPPEQGLGGLPGHRGGALVGEHLAELAQQVDELFDDADKIPGRDGRPPATGAGLQGRQQAAKLLAPAQP